MTAEVLILSSEAPYPLHSGGAYRTASLLHYFARIADVDLILLSESGQPALLPRGLVRTQHVIPLPKNSRATLARYLRNARRALRGVPPLIDRLNGFGPAIESFTHGKHYTTGLVEHFWCAPYLPQMKAACEQTILNLHNIESCLHNRCAGASAGLQQFGHRRFASASARLERGLLPGFDLVLTASDADAARARSLAPQARVAVYPNALPTLATPQVPEDPLRVVFPGNFEYHPNIDGVRFLTEEIWPLLKEQIRECRVRLVGRGDQFVRYLLPRDAGFELTGPVRDALGEIAQAAVVIAPLRAGSGTRIKILEAWAAARAVVATPLAAEGLEAIHGGNIVIAATAAEFAGSVAALLLDPAARKRIGAAGRATFSQRYTWQSAWTGMDRTMQDLQCAGSHGYTE